MSDSEAYTRARIAITDEIGAERERRTNMREPRAPAQSEQARNVLTRMQDQGGRWLFLGAWRSAPAPHRLHSPGVGPLILVHAGRTLSGRRCARYRLMRAPGRP